MAASLERAQRGGAGQRYRGTLGLTQGRGNLRGRAGLLETRTPPTVHISTGNLACNCLGDCFGPTGKGTN